MQTPTICNSPVTTYADLIAGVCHELIARRDLIEAALEYAHGTHTFDDICHMVISGRLRWWPLPNSFMITEISEYPRQKHYHVFMAGGDLAEIKATQQALVAAARLAGCSTITLGGRRGWVKALKDLGWEESHTCAAYSLTDAEKNDG